MGRRRSDRYDQKKPLTPSQQKEKKKLDGRNAYTRAAMEGGKLPDKRNFKDGIEETAYYNLLAKEKGQKVSSLKGIPVRDPREAGRTKATQAQKDAAYKKATTFRKNKKK